MGVGVDDDEGAVCGDYFGACARAELGAIALGGLAVGGKGLGKVGGVDDLHFALHIGRNESRERRLFGSDVCGRRKRVGESASSVPVGDDGQAR